jgi:hypothetical protein
MNDRKVINLEEGWDFMQASGTTTSSARKRARAQHDDGKTREHLARARATSQPSLQLGHHLFFTGASHARGRILTESQTRGLVTLLASVQSFLTRVCVRARDICNAQGASGLCTRDPAHLNVGDATPCVPTLPLCSLVSWAVVRTLYVDGIESRHT